MNDTVLTVMVCAWTSVKYLITLLIPITYIGHFFAFKFWHWKWCMFFWGYRFISWLPFCLHILIIFGNINVFSPIWSMGNLSSIILFCRLYFVLMSKKKKGSNQPWFKYYHIILTVKILGRFLWAFGLEIVHPIWQHCSPPSIPRLRCP